MNFSEKYYKGLTQVEHFINNMWFKDQLKLLKKDGVLIIPNINKKFNKNGDLIKWILIKLFLKLIT